jgi:hypothetical protein
MLYSLNIVQNFCMVFKEKKEKNAFYL